MQIDNEGLGYDNICLIPRVCSEISSRDDVDTGVLFCGLHLNIPMIASPMPDVCNLDMAEQIRNFGGFGIVHRFQEKPSRAKIVMNAYSIGQAIGIQQGWEEEVDAIYDCGYRVLCIDVANGFSQRVGKVAQKIKLNRDCHIIAGNVASAEGYEYLADLGVDAVRVGIAGGSVCTTKTETGVCSPMASTLIEVAEYKYKRGLKAAIIADGGIRQPSDLCKALALGADVVMCGGIFAGCKESPGEVLKVEGKMYKILRGAASFSTQKYEAGKEPKYVEGMETLVPYSGSLENTVKRFMGGLRSSMSYFNANTLSEYRNNVSWVTI